MKKGVKQLSSNREREKIGKEREERRGEWRKGEMRRGEKRRRTGI